MNATSPTKVLSTISEADRTPYEVLVRVTDANKTAEIVPYRIEAEKIACLHVKVIDAAQMCLESAIVIGGLLVTVKGGLGHGQWLPWLKENVNFSAETAQRYMRCFNRRDELKSVSVTDLTAALRLLASPPRCQPKSHKNKSPADVAVKPNPAESAHKWTCGECAATFESEVEAEPIYECGECGTRFSKENSSDGASNHCPDCNKFGAKVSDLGCPECGEGELQQVSQDSKNLRSLKNAWLNANEAERAAFMKWRAV